MDEELDVIPEHMIHVVLYCGRVDCDEVHVIQLDETSMVKAARTGDDSILCVVPEGWGFDRHDGINPALHCPKHRNPPTDEEIEAAYEKMRHDQ